jgi:hypothetical protein
MEVADHYRIRHSEFLSWSQDDRDKAINYHLWKRAACSTCGTRQEEWDPERGGDRHAYSAVLGHCRGCQEIESKREQMKSGPQIRGTYLALQRNPRG